MLVPSSSHHSGNNWLQAGLGKIKITGENRNGEQPTRKANRLEGCKRSVDGLGEDRLKMYMDGPAVFVHRERFNHISLVTLLKSWVLSRTPHFQTLQSPDRHLVLLISFYLAAALRSYATSVRPTLLALRLCASLVFACVTLHQHRRYRISVSWTQTERYSGDIPLPNPSNVAGQTESRTWFTNIGPTLLLCTSMAKLPLTVVFVLSEP